VSLVETLRGKSHDRLKNYKEAISSYQSALVLENPPLTEANLHFRLGWVYMRAKQSQETGLDHLRKANRILHGINDDEAA
jgi:tetratricopeptide (TPR) repeat protein